MRYTGYSIQSITILWQKALNFAMICRLWSLSWIVAVNFNRSVVLQHSAPKNPVLAKELAYFKGQKRPNLRKTGHGPPPKTTADGNGGYAVNSDRTPVAISKNLEHFLTCHVEGGPSRFYKYAWLLNRSRSQMGGMFSQPAESLWQPSNYGCGMIQGSLRFCCESISAFVASLMQLTPPNRSKEIQTDVGSHCGHGALSSVLAGCRRCGCPPPVDSVDSVDSHGCSCKNQGAHVPEMSHSASKNAHLLCEFSHGPKPVIQTTGGSCQSCTIAITISNNQTNSVWWHSDIVSCFMAV